LAFIDEELSLAEKKAEAIDIINGFIEKFISTRKDQHLTRLIAKFKVEREEGETPAAVYGSGTLRGVLTSYPRGGLVRAAISPPLIASVRSTHSSGGRGF
jgi:hypothetical protein